MDAGNDTTAVTGGAAAAKAFTPTSAGTSQTIFDVLRDRGFDLDRATVRDSKLHIRQWTTRRLKGIGDLFTTTAEKLEADGAPSNAKQLLTSVWSKVLLNLRKPRSFPAFGLQRLRREPHPLPAGAPTSEEVRIVITFLESPKFTDTIVVPSLGQLLEDGANAAHTAEEGIEDQRNICYAEDSDSDSDSDSEEDYSVYTPIIRPGKDAQTRKRPSMARSLRKRTQKSYSDGNTDDELPEQQPAKRPKMHTKPSHQAQTQAAAAQSEPRAQLVAAAQPPAETQLVTTASPRLAMWSQHTAQPEHDVVRPAIARHQVAPPPQNVSPAEPDQEPLPVLGFGDKYLRGHDAPRQHAIATWALALRSLPESGPLDLKMTTVVGSLGFGYVEDVQYAACEPLEPGGREHLGRFEGPRTHAVTAAEAGVPAQDQKTPVVFCAMAVPYAYKTEHQVYFGAVPMVLYLDHESNHIYLALPSHMADEAAMQRMEVKLKADQDPTSLNEWRQMAWPSVRRHADDNMLRLSHSQHDDQGAMNGAKLTERFLPASMNVSPLDLMAGYLQMSMNGGPMQRLRPDRSTPHEAAKTLIRDGLMLLYWNHFDPHVRDRMSNSPYPKLPPSLAAPEQHRVHVHLVAREISSRKVIHALVRE